MEEINFRQLCKNLKKRGYEPAEKWVSDFVEEYEKIVFSVEPKNMRLKDIVNKMKDLSDHTRAVWIDGILREFGNGFGSEKWREGYEQGKFEGEFVGNQLKDADKIRQELNKPVIPQFVADWYEENKDDFEFNVWDWIAFRNEPEKLKNKEFNSWINDGEGNPIQTLVNMHQFGYEVEKEKRYLVKFKGFNPSYTILKYHQYDNTWFLGGQSEYEFYRTKHTRKELEQADFGWVFDCEGIEIEEVD